MENVNLHKQKLYALLVAAVGFIAMLLPWETYSAEMQGFQFGGAGGGSINGFHGWGWLSLIGVLGVIAATFMGDKTKGYADMSKNIAMGGFGLVALGAIIFMIRVMQVSAPGLNTGSGFGLFTCLVAGLVGLGWVAGLIKMPENKPPTTPTPPPPAPKA